MYIADTEPKAFCTLLVRVLAIQQIKLAAEEPKEEGSLLERLVGEAYAAEIRRREAEEEAALGQPILVETRPNGHDAAPNENCAA
jgi:hypothetical protein